jgi:hypothetical protein
MWRFLLLNLVALGGVVGLIFVLPPTTPAIPYLVVSGIVIAFLNYTVAVLPRLTDRTDPDRTSRAWKDFRFTAITGGIWLYLVLFTSIGLITAIVTALAILVAVIAIWISGRIESSVAKK